MNLAKNCPKNVNAYFRFDQNTSVRLIQLYCRSYSNSWTAKVVILFNNKNYRQKCTNKYIFLTIIA